MKIFGLLFALFLACAAGAAPAASILVVGDSLSAGYGIELRDGWVTLLQQRLSKQGYPHAVVNASISGDTTAGGRARLPAALATLGGISLFGILGFMIGPVIAALFVTIWEIYGRAFAAILPVTYWKTANEQSVGVQRMQ